jgi:hypothetical protein
MESGYRSCPLCGQSGKIPSSAPLNEICAQCQFRERPLAEIICLRCGAFIGLGQPSKIYCQACLDQVVPLD